MTRAKPYAELAQMVSTNPTGRIHSAYELETGLLMTDCGRILSSVWETHHIGPTCKPCRAERVRLDGVA